MIPSNLLHLKEGFAYETFGESSIQWPSIFVDWLTASQFHQEGGFPIFVGGVLATFDGEGNCVFEHCKSRKLEGSHGTSVWISSDGYRVGITGNVGRYNRPDNLFSYGIRATVDKANRMLAVLGLPPFTPGEDGSLQTVDGSADRGDVFRGGATVSRIDVTCNYSAGSDPQSRAVIRWLANQSIKRAKRGFSGDESVWWANTRMMLKAYRKGPEMRKHGGDEELIQYAEDAGLVRIELELKRRELAELGLKALFDVTDEKLAELYHEHIEPFRRIDSSDEPDILASIPGRSRSYAAAWLAGMDCRLLCSQATLYRHARVLREYGLDILETRNIERFPVKVRVIDLKPLSAPDWYLERLVA